jgi:hypothetical protein
MSSRRTSDKDALDVEDPDKIGEVAEDIELHDQWEGRMERLVGYELSRAELLTTRMALERLESFTWSLTCGEVT